VRSKEKDEGLSKLLGGEVEKGEKEASPSPSIGLRALEASPSPSIGHQAWNIPLATNLWIYLHLPSPSLEKATRIIRGLSWKNIIFDSNLERTCSHNLLWEENGRMGESRLDGGNNFERMEVNRDMLEV
jgi:hypothetical protein